MTRHFGIYKKTAAQMELVDLRYLPCFSWIFAASERAYVTAYVIPPPAPYYSLSVCYCCMLNGR